MGCIQVRVEPDNSVDENESTKSRSTKTYPIAMLRKPLTVTPVISTKSDELIQHRKLSNDYHATDESPLRNNVIILPPSIDSKGTLISRVNVPKSEDMDSNMSDIPEVSSISLTSSELDQLSSIYDPAISSSPDLEHKTYRKDAMNRFLSVRSNRLNNHQALTHENIWSKSDDSYPLRDSFITSTLAGSEGLITDRSKAVKTIFVQPRKANVQQKIFSYEVSSESDDSILHHVTENNSVHRDVKVVTDHLVTVPRSISTRLSNPDYHSKGVTNETTS